MGGPRAGLLLGSSHRVFFALFLNTAAWSFFTVASNQDTGSILTAIAVAPLVEESVKGLAVLVVLWFTRRHIDGVLDGMLIGALVGLGFAMTENITYFGVAYSDGGAAAVGTLFIIRSVINGMGHAVWTSFTGAAVGWSRARHGRGVLRLIVPVIGWGAAVLGHSIWNLGASLVITVLTIGLERVFLLPEWQALIHRGDRRRTSLLNPAAAGRAADRAPGPGSGIPGRAAVPADRGQARAPSRPRSTRLSAIRWPARARSTRPGEMAGYGAGASNGSST